MNIIDELSWRGAVNQMTDEEGLRKLTEEKSISLYCGVDPTGDSMQIGHLIPFMMLKRFANAGHHPYVVIGGGTGAIGDPSGRKTERQLQTLDKIKANAEKLKAQFMHLFGDSENITFVNNYDWLSQISLLDFLRDYGKLFSVNIMLSKEVVASRLEAGISFTEFSSQILQSIDFEHLFSHNDAQLQIGGGPPAGLPGEAGQAGENQRRCRHPRQAQGPAVPLPPPWTGGFDVVLLHDAFSFWGKAMVWRRVSSPQRRRKSSAVSPRPGRVHARAVKPLSCQ
mgnify:CR=1 FL=1